MRPKFLLLLALIAAAVLVPVFYFKSHSNGPVSPPTNSEATVPAAEPATNLAAAEPKMPAINMVSNLPAVTNTMTAEERQAAIDAELERLYQLYRSDDPASLPPILADLNNPEREIRLAAIEATKQFGSKDAIPALKAAAAQTEDLEEKIALLKAADFLTLPAMNLNGPRVELTAEQIKAQEEKINRRHPQKQNPVPSPPGN